MPRRPVRTTQPPRVTRRPVIPSPTSSSYTTPVSSTYPSTYGSEVETESEVAKLSIASLTLDTPLKPLRRPRRVPATPFHFLSLPSELRLKIYEFYFDEGEDVLDLGPDNHKRIHKRLVLMRVCKQLHDEATHFFYGTRSFRIFPTYPGRYFKTKKPLLSRLKPVQRQQITSLELRLGPGWSAPPKGWIVNDALGLGDCIHVYKLTVFVECDPSDSIFKGFRRSEGFYEGFSRKLLASVLEAVPNVTVVEFDAWPSVKKTGGMMHGLYDVAVRSQRLIRWGPERGWTDDMEEDNVIERPPNNAPLFQGVSIPGYISANAVAVA